MERCSIFVVLSVYEIYVKLVLIVFEFSILVEIKIYVSVRNKKVTIYRFVYEFCMKVVFFLFSFFFCDDESYNNWV